MRRRKLLNDIKGSHPIFQPRCPQECFSDISVNYVANLEDLAKEGNQCCDIKTHFTDRSPDAFLRCPQECFHVGTTGNAMNVEEILNEDDLLTYIQNRFIEMSVELSLISSSERHKLKVFNRG